MIPISVAVSDVMAGSRVTGCRVESWRGGDLLAANIPVISGTLIGDRSLQVPEQVTFAVPVEADGVRYDPLYETDPLAPFGQRLRVAVGLQVARKFVWVNRGDFLVTGAQRDGDTVTVQASSLLQLVAEARLVTPLQPTGSDTLKSLARRLIEPAIPVVFASGLVDRAVPVSSLQWDDDRLAAVYELAKAWPADVRMHSDGYLLFEPFNSVGALVGDFREAWVRQVAASNRDGAINCAVARGTDENTGQQYQGVAYDLTEASPTRYLGPFSPFPVPLFYASPLLTSDAMCRTAAATLLARRQRESARAITQDQAPAPYLELGDLVLTDDDRAGDLAMTIETMTLPLVADGGPMTLGLAVPV